MTLALCDISTVKARIGVTDAVVDDLLTSIVNGVSAAIESYLDRKLETAERTEYHNIENPEAPLVLRSYPVTSISSLKSSATWAWDTTTAIDADDYEADSESGVLYVKQRLDRGKRAVQIVYTAGIGTTASDVVSGYPDLSIACEMQAVEEYLRKEAQGAVSLNLSDGGGTMNRSGLKLLPAVKERLAPYRRQLL